MRPRVHANTVMKGERRAPSDQVTRVSSFSALANATARSVFEKCGEGGQAQTVKHPLLRHAAFSRHFNAPVREINLISRVRIGIDTHEAAEFENDIGRERQQDGINKAKAEGVRFGPKPLLTLEVVQKIKELRSDGATVPEIMRRMKLSKASLYRALNT
jgi:hypothetical protein